MASGTRNYDSSGRQSRARDRILEAALGLARERSGWSWADITFKTVAEAADVSERTVHRHFTTQRDLHDAMLLRINETAAISYQGLGLEDIPRVVDRLFTSLSTFRPDLAGTTPPSEAAVAMNRERMQALMSASGGDTRLAALLDVLWSVEAFDRLVVIWRLSPQEAVDAVTWALGELTGPDH